MELHPAAALLAERGVGAASKAECPPRWRRLAGRPATAVAAAVRTAAAAIRRDIVASNAAAGPPWTDESRVAPSFAEAASAPVDMLASARLRG